MTIGRTGAMTMDRLHYRPEAKYQKQDAAKRTAVRASSVQEGNVSDGHFGLYLNMTFAFTPIAKALLSEQGLTCERACLQLFG